MTYPPASPPPSDGCTWELLIGIEAGAANTEAARRYRELLLCRTIRSLCAERQELRAREVLMFIASGDEQGDDETLLGVVSRAFATLPELKRGIREAEAERDKARDQLSAYTTAAEGRPASELIAPSEVERLRGALHESHDKLGAAKLEIERLNLVVGKDSRAKQSQRWKELTSKLAERDAEIELLREFHAFACEKWSCFGGSPGNEPCTLNNDPDPEVFCMAHYAWDVRDEIARLKS